jgi:predicted  nucleic acid-binding Zn-ribbon protein
MPSTVEDTASCALCRRHLLVGEPARLYQDPQSKRFAKVCPLCYERADRRGWRAEGRPIVAVHANPPSDHLLRERESLIDRLRGQLQSVEFDLDRVRSALAKAEQQAAELRGIKRELKDLQGEVRKHEREVRSLQDEKRRADERAAQAEAAHKSEIARHHAVAATLDERAAEMAKFEQVQGQLEQELQSQRARYAELAEARRKESDARHVRRLALEAFNRSEHMERVVAIARSLGDPIVNVHCDGLELPRPVKITVVWDISWYEYVVRLDLLEHSVTVEETRRGDDPRELPAVQLEPNGVLRADRIVLAMQAYGVGQSAANAR